MNNWVADEFTVMWLHCNVFKNCFRWFVARLSRRCTLPLLLILGLLFLALLMSATVRLRSRDNTEAITKLSYYLNILQNTRNDALLEDNRPNKIFLWGMGRLGNQLFQYSMIWSLGKRTGRPVFFVTDLDFKGMFPGLTVPILTPTIYLSRVQRHLQSVAERRTSFYEERFPIRIRKGDLKICCYFQSYKNFWPYKDQFQKEFIFSDSMRAIADRSLRSAHLQRLGDDKVQSTRFVAVHVRRGDLVSPFNYRRGYRPAEPSYFYKAMEMFKNKSEERVLFIVASDDQQWVLEHLQLKDTYVSTGRSAAEDMALLAACNDTIFSMGTFGWWAAFLTNGRKVYFRDALLNHSNIAWHYPVNDTFPPEWLALEN